MHLLPLLHHHLLLSRAQAADKTANPTLNTALKNAPTTQDRHALLSPTDWIYDFNTATPLPSTAFKPGSVKNANAATFPVMTGLGMTIAQLNLGPCAMLPPHLHPRATNIVLGITGNTTTYMWNENGVGVVKTELTPGVVTVFPAGGLHAMQNNGCDNAYLVSALNSEDTGTLTVLNGLYQMPQDMVRAAFGNADIDVDEVGRGIPDIGTGSVIGSAECLARCRLNRDGSPMRGKGRKVK